MVDPFRITNYDRSPAELEEFLLFAVAVAGKNAQTTSRRLEAFLWQAGPAYRHFSPFERIMQIGYPWTSEERLREALRKAGIGQYNRIAHAYAHIVSRWDGRDLGKLSPSDLEKVPGIGPKTSRFFILHTRPFVRLAVLDVHILRRLRELGYPAPATTPDGRKYEYWESVFIDIADRLEMTPADLDLLWWKEGALKRG